VDVNPVAPFIVTTTVQLFAPTVNVPAVAPPVVAETEHPVVVNLVPLEINPLAFNPAAVSVPVTVGLAPKDVRLDAVTDEANVVPVNPLAGIAAAVIEVLHPNPVLVVHFSALPEVEHEPTANAVGDALPDVELPVTVFVACVASFVRAIDPDSIVLVTVPVSVVYTPFVTRPAVKLEPVPVRPDPLPIKLEAVTLPDMVILLEPSSRIL